jgi:hypothetical protein
MVGNLPTPGGAGAGIRWAPLGRKHLMEPVEWVAFDSVGLIGASVGVALSRQGRRGRDDEGPRGR